MVSPEVQGCIWSLIYILAAESAVWANSWDNMSYQTVINLKSDGKVDWQRIFLFYGYCHSKSISQKRDPPALSRQFHVAGRITNLFIFWSIHHLFSKAVLAGWHLSVHVGAQAAYPPFLERFRAKRTLVPLNVTVQFGSLFSAGTAMNTWQLFHHWFPNSKT